MANKRTGMRKIREIIRLNFQMGLSERKISRALNVSRDTTNKVLKAVKDKGLGYEDVEKLNHDELSELIYQPDNKKVNEKYENLKEWFPYITRELKRTGVTLTLLWQEYKAKNPDGYRSTQFNYHYQKWREDSDVGMHIEHKAGDKMFVDYAGKKMEIVDSKTGESKQVSIFVSILGASGLIYAQASLTQKQEDFIIANENAIRFYEGAPAAIVPDCLKTGVKKTHKYEPDINPVYSDFAKHYGTTILPARAYKPKDKALVENAVRLVYMNVYAPLRNTVFHSLDELNTAIQEKLSDLNNKKYQKMNVSRRELFEQTEKCALKPLPFMRFEMKRYKRLKVQFNYHVEIREDKHYYSVPFQYKGKNVEVIYNQYVVEIYHENKRIAFHRRDLNENKYSTLKEHMPPDHKFYGEWSYERIINWASTIGVNTKSVVKRILEEKQHPEQGFKVCLGLLNLAKNYSQERLEKACEKAIIFNTYSYKGIKLILDKKLDMQSEQLLFQTPVHENIRGNQYYN